MTRRQGAARPGPGQPAISALERRHGRCPAKLAGLAAVLSAEVAGLVAEPCPRHRAAAGPDAALRAEHRAAVMEGNWFWLAGEAAGLTRVPGQTICRLAQSGERNGLRAGNQVRIPRAAAGGFLRYGPGPPSRGHGPSPGIPVRRVRAFGRRWRAEALAAAGRTAAGTGVTVLDAEGRGRR